ncbi:hypothetical protein ACFFV7_41110 [Nonomuraea spiralis]|uniref:Uncharacterized protein n=1 Tax=Nonomuraea spiralis TaxID=46182 RepID=A0ABV5ISX4_9ACTN|nr:hypothetical protein [Nonomuraea spiralis]
MIAIAAAFLASPEFRGLPDADRNRLYEIDAALTERQRSRQR